MIIKAELGTGRHALVRSLEGGKNEQTEFLEVRNMMADSIKEAIEFMDLISRCRGAKCDH
jgi:hypothetical protein